MSEAVMKTTTKWAASHGTHVTYSTVSYTVNGQPAVAVLPFQFADVLAAMAWIENMRRRADV